MAGENSVSLSDTDCMSTVLQWAVRQARYCMSAMWVLKDNLIFSPLSAYSPTHKAIKNTLKPPSLVYNLYAT
jgi:hypothetical protein